MGGGGGGGGRGGLCTCLYGQVCEKKYNGLCVRESKRERGMEEEREREGGVPSISESIINTRKESQRYSFFIFGWAGGGGGEGKVKCNCAVLLTWRVCEKQP